MRTVNRRRILRGLLFAVYLVLVVWIALWKLHLPYLGSPDTRDIKLIPFVAGEGFGASAPWEVLANVLLFLPFGVYLGLLAPSRRLWKQAGVLIGASVLLEVTEFVLAVGRSDVTDVIVNASGGLLGIGILALARRSNRARADTVVTWVLVFGTIVALLTIGMVVASFPRIPPAERNGPAYII